MVTRSQGAGRCPGLQASSYLLWRRSRTPFLLPAAVSAWQHTLHPGSSAVLPRPQRLQGLLEVVLIMFYNVSCEHMVGKSHSAAGVWYTELCPTPLPEVIFSFWLFLRFPYLNSSQRSLNSNPVLLWASTSLTGLILGVHSSVHPLKKLFPILLSFANHPP